MSLTSFEYFMARAAEEEQLAATSVHRDVKALHEGYAAEYRASAFIAAPDVTAPTSVSALPASSSVR